MVRRSLQFILFSLVVVIVSCSEGENDYSVMPIEFYTPEGFPPPEYTLNNNPLSYNRFELGRKLFYDPILSIDSTISCGSCHQQQAAFAHQDHRFSHGINGLLGTRNSPAIINMAWNPDFFWDGGVHNLELQPLAPITNPVEMNENLPNVLMKLRRSPTYSSLFKSAFGTDSIVTSDLMKALAQFMAVMISDKSRYDYYLQGKVAFTKQETSGLNVFRANCASCHKEPLLTDYSFRNNGLDSVFVKDPGRARITGSPQDSGKFKVPTLRNIMLTKPYMHDGRFATLSQVLDHYQSKIHQSSTLDPSLVNGISLTAEERADLLAFLATLTDNHFIHNKDFSEY